MLKHHISGKKLHGLLDFAKERRGNLMQSGEVSRFVEDVGCGFSLLFDCITIAQFDGITLPSGSTQVAMQGAR